MTIQDDFRAAMASWASGVSVVCTREDGLAYGITVSSFSSLSFDPLIVLVCIANSNRAVRMIEASGVFSVSLLAADQAAVSNHFASSGREPSEQLDGADTAECALGVPIIRGAMAHVTCKLHSALQVGDHTICCGEVVEAFADESKAPLLYYRRGYRELAD